MLSKVIRVLAPLACLAILLVSGCIFSPDRKPPKKIVVDFPAADSPIQTLTNLVNAYNTRDTTQTKAAYDILYQGQSTEAGVSSYAFNRQAEIDHVKRLHDDPNIIGVSLDLGQPATWQVLPGLATDPPGSVVIPIQYATISIQDVSSSTWVFKPVTMEYAFKPTVNGSTTLWTVIRWTETAN